MSAREDAADALAATAPDIAQRVTQVHFARHPQLDERYGQDGRVKCTEDVIRHLQYLTTAVRAGHPEVYAEYVEWTRTVLEGVGLPPDDLRDHLATLGEVVSELLPDHAQAIAAVADPALRSLTGATAEVDSFLTQGTHAALARRYLDVVLAGDRSGAVSLITDAMEAGADLEAIYVEVFQPVLREVGRLWQLNRISVAQEHLVTATTQLVMSTLYPRIFAARRPPRGRMLATCVSGELHEVGTRMLADIFELRGWDTRFVGANVPIVDLLDAVDRHDPDVVAISATLAPHVEQVGKLVAEVRVRGRPRIVLVGGRPFLSVPELVQLVGADGTAPDAVAAVELVDRLEA